MAAQVRRLVDQAIDRAQTNAGINPTNETAGGTGSGGRRRLGDRMTSIRSANINLAAQGPGRDARNTPNSQ